jgi:hypothetical protein
MFSVARQIGPRVTTPETNGEGAPPIVHIMVYVPSTSLQPPTTLLTVQDGGERLCLHQDNAHSPGDRVPHKDYYLSTLLHEPYLWVKVLARQEPQKTLSTWDLLLPTLRF